MLTLASLFDGIGGWLIAAHRNGIKPVWSSEIEDFPMKVSKAHFPDVEQLGDVTKINGGEVLPVDIICAGSPCQDLSVAGNQKGLAGSRSNLFFESVRIVREMREATNGVYPKFFVWENVTGAFSSNHGRDFQAVLGEITQTDIPMPGSGRWSKAGMVRGKRVGCAWRVLDAQYWGVPQHRERIFLIAGFGKWGGAVQVLFKPESVRRDSAESESEGKDASRIAGNCSEKAGGTMEAELFPTKSYTVIKQGLPASTLKAKGGAYGGGSENYIVETKICKESQAVLKRGEMFVRKLTPLECERLQGLPDNYTAYGSDTARYKAIGNGMAQPCADFVLSKVVEMFEEADDET